MYVITRSRCMSGCGVQTSARRRLGKDWLDTFEKVTDVAVKGTTTVVSARKGKGNSAPVSSQKAPDQPMPDENAEPNFLSTLPNSTLAIGGVAGLALLIALTNG